MNDGRPGSVRCCIPPPLECDLSIRLDRVTVESVARLDQLAPYGAENPTPVFLLQSAVVDGVYPVSEGRHSRLRLRQGNSCLYAVWFGMPAEQLPYALGGVVVAGLLYLVLALLFKLVGAKKVMRFFPPIVTGPIIIAIG